MITIILLSILIELIFSPRIDITKNKNILLWYGKYKRNYIKIL